MTIPAGLPDPADHTLAWWNGEPAIYAWWRWAKDTGQDLGTLAHTYRIIARYSEAVPTRSTIDLLTGLGPLVEVGAGNGYWARLIGDVGGDVVATDSREWFGEVPTWTEVQHADADETVQLHPDRTILACWPPRPNGYMTAVLDVAPQDTLALVTDGPCQLEEDPLYARLDRGWTLIERHATPQWPGRFDDLAIWRRR